MTSLPFSPDCKLLAALASQKEPPISTNQTMLCTYEMAFEAETYRANFATMPLS